MGSTTKLLEKQRRNTPILSFLSSCRKTGAVRWRGLQDLQDGEGAYLWVMALTPFPVGFCEVRNLHVRDGDYRLLKKAAKVASVGVGVSN